ncbi:hypothetical protein OAM69_04725 [bacterium]|nr:hypothetical protein [bacterium]
MLVHKMKWLFIALRDFVQQAHLSLNCFNDVHHVVPTEHKTLLVVSTGLDLVVEIDMTGKIVREWFTIESSDWSRFSRSTNYRKVLSIKPHHSHPNFVLQHDGQVWAARFEQKMRCV